MKKILFTFFAIVSLFTISSCGDNKDEPSLDEDGWIDPVFAKVLQERGYIADAKTVTPLDVASIESIDVSGEMFSINPGPIKSMKGLNYFTSLTELFCLNNQLTTLDISKNRFLISLDCDQNPGKDGWFIVTSWFDKPPVSEDVTSYFTNRDWTINGQIVKIEYRKV